MAGNSAKKPRLSDAGAKMLANLVNGLSIGAHLRGVSAFGGTHATEWALRQHGWIDSDGAITPAGRKALANHRWQ